MTARQAAAPTIDTTRRTRNGSILQSKKTTGINKRMAVAIATRTLGNIIQRKANVSPSMIMASMKLTDIERTPNLKRETMIRIPSISSDRAAERPGRHSTTSQRKFSKPHAAAKIAIRSRPVSLHAKVASAARWNVATGTSVAAPCLDQAPSRVDRGAGGEEDTVIGWDDFQVLDKAGINKQPIEALRLGPLRAVIEQPAATFEDFLLFRKWRKAGGPLYDQRQRRRIQQVGSSARFRAGRPTCAGAEPVRAC